MRRTNFVPCLLYVSNPTTIKASQILAALCSSRFAMTSISLFRFELILKVRRASFFIGAILAPVQFENLQLAIDFGDYNMASFRYSIGIHLSSLWMTLSKVIIQLPSSDALSHYGRTSVPRFEFLSAIALIINKLNTVIPTTIGS